MTRTADHRDKVKFLVKSQKMFDFCWNCLKSDCLTGLEGFELYLKFFVFV